MTEKKADTTSKNKARRKLLRNLAAGGGVMATGALLPKEWTTPIVEFVDLPAHAQVSPAPGGGGTRAVTGNFGPAMMVGARNDSPSETRLASRSVLDLVVSPAHASAFCPPTAATGSIRANMFAQLLANSYTICGCASVLNVTSHVTLSGGGTNNNNVLSDYSQMLTPGVTLNCTGLRALPDPDRIVCMCSENSGPPAQWVLQTGNPVCGGQNDALTIKTSSPYTDDEEVT